MPPPGPRGQNPPAAHSRDGVGGIGAHPAFLEHASTRKWGLVMLPVIRTALKSAAAVILIWFVRPVRDLVRTLRRRHPVRVFTFHRLARDWPDGMTVDPAVFASQVSYVKRYHTVVSLGEALRLLADRARLEHPVAVFTFDDAYRSVYREALPVMDAEGVVGCCFVTTGIVETEGRFEHDTGVEREDLWRVMTWEELARLQQRGWEIGGHSHTHPRLSAISAERLRGELETPLRVLRERLDIAAPIPMALPFGGAGDITVEGLAEVREAGYSACCSDYGGENVPPGDRFDIRRIELGGNHPTLAWKARSHGLDLARLRTRMTDGLGGSRDGHGRTG